MPTAYEGGEPYIFVSYAHKDSAKVVPIIDAMQSQGYRIWFDEGIEAGSEWPEYIADHLNRCSCVLGFVTATYVESQNCKRELTFALDKKKPVLSVFLENVNLSLGLELQLGLSQALLRRNFKSDADFLDALCRAQMLGSCRETSSGNEVQRAQKPVRKASRPMWDGLKDKMLPKPPAEKSRGFVITKLVLLLTEVGYCLTMSTMLGLMTSITESTGQAILMPAIYSILHMMFTFCGWMLCGKMAENLHKDQKNNIFRTLVISWAISTLVAAVGATPRIAYEINAVLRFLYALAANLLSWIWLLMFYNLYRISTVKTEKQENK